jgi:uncharacterized protein
VGAAARLLPGLWIFGTGEACLVHSRLGNSPWTVLAEGVSKHSPLAIGTATIVISGLVMLAWIPLRQRPGIGTVINTITIGLVANATLAVVPNVERLAVRLPLFVIALLSFGLGGGLYIGSGLGPGPRDGLMTGLTARGFALWKVRTIIECSALVTGFLLGGSVGVGTVVIALTLGPLTHAALRRFHLPVHDDSNAVLGE